MGYFITIDGGTTNTRAVLLDSDGRGIAMVSTNVGVRVTAAEGKNTALKNAVKDCIHQLLIKNKLDIDMVTGIYASGMLTSALGLIEVPHIEAPAAITDFVRGIHTAEIQDVCARHIHFIPGLKNRVNGGANIDSVDIMRGEETEAFGLLSYLPACEDYLLALPGSHSKYVQVDRAGRITGCLTSMTGELLDALTKHTILADAVGGDFLKASEYDKDAVIQGYEMAKKSGFGRAAFLTRILSQKEDSTPERCQGFLLGAVLESDVHAVKHSSALSDIENTTLVISGKEPFQTALYDLFKKDGCIKNVRLPERDLDCPLSSEGAYKIAVIHQSEIKGDENV